MVPLIFGGFCVQYLSQRHLKDTSIVQLLTGGLTECVANRLTGWLMY